MKVIYQVKLTCSRLIFNLKVVMIRCRLSNLMGERKILKLSEVAQATGINRNTLTSLYYDRAVRIELSVANTLCEYFNCNMQDLFEYSEDS